MTANATLDSLGDDPVAIELLSSTNPARLAYAWTDGTPRVVPIWFHWDGRAIVLGTPARAPKLTALRRRPDVALTIDSDGFPYHVLSIRGVAQVEDLRDVCDEYVAAARRYFGPERGTAWAESLRGRPMARVRITPQWVNIIDFDTRLPTALQA